MINNPEKMQSKKSIASPQESVATSFRLTELGLIPEDWDVVSIHEVTDIRVGKDVNEKRISTEFDNKFCYPVFSNTVDEPGIYGYYDYAEYLGDAVTVVGRGVGLGTAICRSGGFGAIGRLIVLFPKGNIIFLSNYINHSVNVFNESSGVPQLTGVALGNCKIAWPPLKEQIAIASVLSDTDALITELKQLITKKQFIKNATMQQLLTGRTRLPQFSQYSNGTLKNYKSSELGLIPEDWEVARLVQVARVIDPHPSHRAPPEESYGVPFVGIGDLNESGELINSEVRRVNQSILQEHSERYTLHNQPIGLGRVASIGKVIRLRLGKEPYAISPTLGVIDGFACTNDFLFYYLKSESVTEQFSRVMSGSTRSSVGMNVLKEILVVKISNEEQISIAAILSDMDAELKALEQKLAKFRSIKQGMMQQLLTGRIRLPLEQQP